MRHLSRALLYLLLMPILVLTSQSQAQATQPLPDSIGRTASALGIPTDAISIWVADLGADEALLALHAHRPRNPASTMKLVTTFAALQGLGPAYRWRTEVYALGPVRDGRLDGDLLLRGTGDPYLVEEEFWKLVRDLRRSGLQHIDGKLIFDTTHFLLPPESAGEFDGRPDRVYNLIPHPLLVNFNAFQFEFEPIGSQVGVRVSPTLYNLEVHNRLGLVQRPCAGFQRGVALHVLDRDHDGYRNRVSLEGRFPDACPRYALTRTALRPESYAYGLFRQFWEQQGGTLAGGWRHGELPAPMRLQPLLVADAPPNPPAMLQHVHYSRPLGDLIRLANKYSNNVMTRHLYLALGAERHGAPATPDKAQSAMLEVLQGFGLETRDMVIDNAAGLSRTSRLTAYQLSALLEAAWDAPFMPEFVSSLALGGMDGTLRRRFADFDDGSVLHLKSGSLDDVSALAGYLQLPTGERRIMVVMVNHVDAHRGTGEEIHEAVLRWALQAPAL